MKLLLHTARKIKELASDIDGSGMSINRQKNSSKAITLTNYKEEYRLEFFDNEDIDNFIEKLHELK